jgi:chemotaxis protein CheY-P-specific phosphatase CheC
MNVFSDISIWWILPLSFTAFLLAGLYYFLKPNTSLSRNIRLVLFLLRGFGLAFIFLLLLGVLYQSRNYSSERPILLIYQDESASMLNYSDSSAVKETMEGQISALSSALASKFDVKIYSFSDKLTDSIHNRFEGTATNLSLPFQHLRNVYINRNVGAVVFISDGNFNQGISPLYETEKLTHTPVYSIMVGDTITKRDAAIRTVRVNQIAFSGNISTLADIGVSI